MYSHARAAVSRLAAAASSSGGAGTPFYDRTATLSRSCVSTLLYPDEYSSVLWSWQLPAGQSYAGLHDALKAEGFIIYAGQGELGRQIFRIAHMGDIQEADLQRLCTVLTATLSVQP